ncbi:MAG: WYL domain-containing protein [Saprospiraceae bacterium]|nr:WYL domain-containing protein [Saprospiraceae bacterium]
MAINKNALIRYKILDQCFRNFGKNYFIEDLIEECNKVLSEMDSSSDGISLRQVRDDIAFMRSKEGWEIELADLKEGKKKIYRYAVEGFSINNMPLNEMEINKLKSALGILSQFKGMPQFEWINEMIPKLKEGITIEENNTHIMDFDSNQYLRGIENIGILYDAIFYKKILKFQYQPFENESADEIILHPYFLKQYNNRWFLFGYNPENEKYDWNLAIDRIQSIKEIRGKYLDNTMINWNEYFDDIIGVTKPDKGDIEKITLHVYGRTGHYILTKPLHGSQKDKWLDKETLELRLELIINYEFERLILSYGESVKVIAPIKFINQIKDRINKSNEMYNPH